MWCFWWTLFITAHKTFNNLALCFLRRPWGVKWSEISFYPVFLTWEVFSLKRNFLPIFFLYLPFFFLSFGFTHEKHVFFHFVSHGKKKRISPENVFSLGFNHENGKKPPKKIEKNKQNVFKLFFTVFFLCSHTRKKSFWNKISVRTFSEENAWNNIKKKNSRFFHSVKSCKTKSASSKNKCSSLEKCSFFILFHT